MEGNELSWQERGRLWTRLGLRLALTALVLLLLFFVAPPLLTLFMPFVLAFLLAWLLNPLIKFFQKRMGASRKFLSLLLILLIFAGAGGILAAFIYNIVAEIISLSKNWESILAAGQSALETMSGYFSHLRDLLPQEVAAAANQLGDRLLLWLNDTLPSLLSGVGVRATDFAMTVPSFAVAMVVFIMGSYFITADYPHVSYLIGKGLTGGVGRFLRHVRSTAVSALGGYVKAEIILSIGVFFILLVGFVVTGQPYALLLAFLLAILDFIPILGAGTVMIPWAVADLFLGNFREAVELMVIWGIIALFRRVAEPKVVGDQTGLPPVMSLVSIYVGMRLGGVLGMILGPVVCMVVFNVCKSGIFDNVIADLRMAAGDLSAFFQRR